LPRSRKSFVCIDASHYIQTMSMGTLFSLKKVVFLPENSAFGLVPRSQEDTKQATLTSMPYKRRCMPYKKRCIPRLVLALVTPVL
jgi:hypothetical protein